MNEIGQLIQVDNDNTVQLKIVINPGMNMILICLITQSLFIPCSL